MSANVLYHYDLTHFGFEDAVELLAVVGSGMPDGNTVRTVQDCKKPVCLMAASTQKLELQS